MATMEWTGSLSAQEHQTQLRRAVIASTVGTAIEWYDFFLYSVVTGLVFAKLFFPNSDPLVGTLEAFGIYAVGFVARPIGAALFGHYGDRIGRKTTLIATLLLTGLSTFALGFVAPAAVAWGLGPYGDRIGRKTTLIATLLLTGLSTFAVGFVPGYDQIGIWGAVILVTVRFVRAPAL